MSAPAVHLSEDGTLRQAADLMKKHGLGRIPIVTRNAPHHVVGITTRSDLVAR
jgi:CIC family chloride channel protein